MQIALQNVAILRAHADARFRGLQEYRNLETPREESTWLVAQARTSQPTVPERASDESRSLRTRLTEFLRIGV
ncbi:MAG: hypothetical protein WAN87_07155, partial [Thermoplasmata archaeon]